MRTRARTAFGVALLATLAAATGCTTYHHITEPTTGRTYLTTNLDDNLRRATGAVVFTDAVTGAEVTLANSEVIRLGEHEYRELLRRAQASPQPTPAQDAAE
ncbi:MAG: hypothetical protein ACTS22_07735 [Phycisphaerales bacterium]